MNRVSLMILPPFFETCRQGAVSAVLHLMESGCRRRQIPREFGRRHIIYVRMQHWADNGIWPRTQESLKSRLDISLDITVLLCNCSVFEEVPDGRWE